MFLRFTRSLDVIAHELAHGVTEHTCDLVYWEQPGALNEHFSDVIGSLVKQWHLNQKAADADWLVGAELLGPELKQPPGLAVALRSLKAPGLAYDDPLLGRDPQPAHMKDLYKGASDSGGVHINSGIPNHAFYRVATAFGGYAWEKAGKIWWRAFTEKGRMSQRASFREAAKETIEVAGLMYDSKAAKLVAAAWEAVGVVPLALKKPAPATAEPAKGKAAPKKKAPAPKKPAPKKSAPKKTTTKKPAPKKPPATKKAAPKAAAGKAAQKRTAASALAARAARETRRG